jgi:hypothetical protein
VFSFTSFGIANALQIIEEQNQLFEAGCSNQHHDGRPVILPELWCLGDLGEQI